MGPSSLLLWSSCLLLTVFSPPAVVADPFWCPPETELGGCPASDANTMLKITVYAPDGVNTCEKPPGKPLPCDGENAQYASITNADTCKSFCNDDLSNAAKPCQAYTYVDNREGGKHDLCFFLKNCEGDQDEPCDQGDECSGGFVCDKKACTTDSDCSTDTEYCSDRGYCKEYDHCDTPKKLDHDYSEPEKRHWGPCLNSDDDVDNDCNVYLTDKECQLGTVCTLSKCRNDEEVKHTCKQGKWMRTVGTGGETDVDEENDWKEPVCKACGQLTIIKEPGLSLFCKDSTEPEDAGLEFKITDGPCNMYCNGILIHHIRCDTTTELWTGDEGVTETDTFYCWNKPDGKWVN